MSNKSKRFTIPCQDWIKIDPSVPHEIKNNLEKYFESYTPSEKLVADYYIALSATCTVVYPTDGFVAKKLGVSRETVQRVKRRLVADGVMAKNYRHMHSCLYKISSYFRDFSVRKRLWDIFPALKIMPLIFLLSSVQKITANLLKSTQSEYDTHINNEYSYKSLSVIDTNVPIAIGDILLQIGLQTEKNRINPGTCMKKDGITTPEERPSRNNEETRKLIEPEVLKIIEIQLTKWGQIRLCAFSGPTVIYARMNFDKSLKGQSAYYSLFMNALSHCRENNIEPDFKRIEFLATRFNMPDNPRLVIDEATLLEKSNNNNVDLSNKSYIDSNAKHHKEINEQWQHKSESISAFDEKEVYDCFENAKQVNTVLSENLKKLGLDQDWNPMKRAVRKD